MNEIREIKTEPAGVTATMDAFRAFMERYDREGVNLRMENITNINGGRFVLVFDWDDMG